MFYFAEMHKAFFTLETRGVIEKEDVPIKIYSGPVSLPTVYLVRIFHELF